MRRFPAFVDTGVSLIDKSNVDTLLNLGEGQGAVAGVIARSSVFAWCIFCGWWSVVFAGGFAKTGVVAWCFGWCDVASLW